MKYIKSKMLYAIVIAFTLVMAMTYSIFVVTTSNTKSANLMVSNLLYGISIFEENSSTPLQGTSLSIPANTEKDLYVSIYNVSRVESKYVLAYQGNVQVLVSSRSSWNPSGGISEYQNYAYGKTIKIVVKNTTSSAQTVSFSAFGGLSSNSYDNITIPSGWIKITDIETETLTGTRSLVDTVKDDLNCSSDSTCLYGSESNNYIQISSSDASLYRIVGIYNLDGTDAIKVTPLSYTDVNSLSVLTNSNLYETNYFDCETVNNLDIVCDESEYTNVGYLTEDEVEVSGSYLPSDNPAAYIDEDTTIIGQGTSSSPYKIAYSAFFDYGSGSGNVLSKTIIDGETYGELPVATPPAGSTFVGWALNGDSITSSTVVNTSENQTLVASYIQRPNVISFDHNVPFNDADQNIMFISTFQNIQNYSFDFPQTLSTSNFSVGDYVVVEANLSYTDLTVSDNVNYFSQLQAIGNVTGSNSASYTYSFDQELIGTGTKKIYWTFPVDQLFKSNAYYSLTIRLDYYTGGSIVISDIRYSKSKQFEYVSGSTFGTIEQPTYSGYTFDGWFTSPTGGSQITASSNVPQNDTTYYAHWTTGQYTLTIKSNGGLYTGSSSDSLEEFTVTNGINTYLGLRLPTRSQYKFTGWTLEGAGKLIDGIGNASVRSPNFYNWLRTDSDFSQYSKYYLQGANNSYTPQLKSDTYPFTVGHTYKIVFEMRLNTFTDADYLEFRHSAYDNDLGSDGRKTIIITPSNVSDYLNKGWKRYEMYRTFTSSTIVGNDGEVVNVEPLFEAYAGIPDGASAYIDFDMRNYSIIDINDNTVVDLPIFRNFNYAIYIYGPGDATLTANWEWNMSYAYWSTAEGESGKIFNRSYMPKTTYENIEDLHLTSPFTFIRTSVENKTSPRGHETCLYYNNNYSCLEPNYWVDGDTDGSDTLVKLRTQMVSDLGVDTYSTSYSATLATVCFGNRKMCCRASKNGQVECTTNNSNYCTVQGAIKAYCS